MSRRRVQIPAYVACRVVDEMAVLFNAETGQYFGLDDVGARVWSLLSSSSDLESVYDALLADYQVAPDALRRDVDALVESLRARDLVRVDVV